VKHLIAEFDTMRRRYPAEATSSMVLPCLRRIQEDRGYVAEEDIVGVVEYLKVPRIQVEEVLSYYTMLRRHPIGKYHLQACRNIACSMRGSEGVIAHLCRKLGVQPGQTTPDGRFTVTEVECLGSCGTAPVVMVNEAYHENMSAEKLDRLIEGLK
jgi:NADH-quinone oxidoreductase subunit E